MYVKFGLSHRLITLHNYWSIPIIRVIHGLLRELFYNASLTPPVGNCLPLPALQHYRDFALGSILADRGNGSVYPTGFVSGCVVNVLWLNA